MGCQTIRWPLLKYNVLPCLLQTTWLQAWPSAAASCRPLRPSWPHPSLSWPPPMAWPRGLPPHTTQWATSAASEAREFRPTRTQINGLWGDASRVSFGANATGSCEAAPPAWAGWLPTWSSKISGKKHYASTSLIDEYQRAMMEILLSLMISKLNKTNTAKKHCKNCECYPQSLLIVR